MLLGFLIKNEDDWQAFRNGVAEVRPLYYELHNSQPGYLLHSENTNFVLL